MRPHWVRDLYRYWEWLDKEVLGSGGFLVNRASIEPTAVADDDVEDDWRLLIVSNHLLNFYDGRFLNFRLTVTSDMELLDYAYHYAVVGGDMIWRACKNDHQLKHLDSETHVHINRDEVVLPSEEVDFDDVLASIRVGRIPGI